MHKHNFVKFSTGFRGCASTAEEAVTTPFIESTVARLQYDPSIFNRNPKKIVLINHRIIELNDSYMIKTAAFLRRFDNREEVIHQALKAFGNDFTNWYRVQVEDRALDKTSLEFIEDTCQFILTGTRRYPLESWQRMLEVKSGPIGYIDVPKHVSQLTRVFSHNRTPTERRFTTDVVQKWLSQPSGIIDMLRTLYVMFGQVK